MRPIETLLLVANVLSVFALVVPWLRVLRWVRHWTPITLLIAIAQVLMEGARWQLVPVYALSGSIFLIWLLRNIVLENRHARQKRMNRLATGGLVVSFVRTSRLVTGLTVGLGVVGLAISTALPIVLPVFHFPIASGPYKIGTVTYHWVDASRREVFSTDPNARRELMVQIWYPAKANSGFPRSLYIEEAKVVSQAIARLHNFPKFSLEQLKYVTTNAAESVPVADDKVSYPVLIFLEGLTGYRQMNTFQVEELVSHGYIVAGVDQPGAAASVVFRDGHQLSGLSKSQMDPLTQQSVSPTKKAPLLNGQIFKDGIIPYLAQDVGFTLEQLASINNTDPNSILTGKLDLQRTGMFGVSFGGIVGAEACLKEPRIKACLMMDVFMPIDVVQRGLKQPGMWITRPADTMRLERRRAGGWTDRDIEQTVSTMRAVYNALPGDGYFVQVPGMFHIDFTDLT